MFKLNDTNYQTIVVHNGSQPDLESGRRLIVPIPSPEADLTEVMRRVWRLANETGARVLLLGLCNDTRNEPALRRTLATISALVNTGNVIAESEIAYGRNWDTMLKARVQAGDLIISWSEQRLGLLQAEFECPIYFLSRIQPKNEQLTHWLSGIVVWVGSIAIIVGFLFIQIQVTHFTGGWSTVLQLLSLAGEIGAVLFWNSLVG